MASNQEETLSIDVSGFFSAFVKADSDSETEDDDEVSMFCTACLHPYNGEEKGGTIVLKCKRCGQTDTILEEKVGNISPRQWIGDAMRNRFLQVVKEQENLKLNLVDPNFQEDNYKRITLALQEYTHNIQAVAECMYDVVKQLNFPDIDDSLTVSVEREAVEIEAMRATNRLIKIHKALLENSNSGLEPLESETQICKRGGRRKGGVKKEIEYTEYDSDTKAIIEMSREHSQTLGNTVLTLINELIDKYDLPKDLMDRLEERIIKQYHEDREKENRRVKKDRQKQFEAGLSSKKARKRQKRAMYKKRAAEADKNKDDVQRKKDECNDTAESVLENKEDATENVKDSENEKSETDESIQEKRDNDPFVEQFFSVLEEKFSIKFYEEELVTGLISDVTDEEIEKKEESESADSDKENDCKGAEGGTSPERRIQKREISMQFKKTSDGFMVNFYTLSAAFINELQAIKSKSLESRKEKALAELHTRIQRMKDEMEKIEDVVTAELSKAYERKIKKSVKQQQVMNDRKRQLKDAKKWIDFYASTGQHDKIREMRDELHRVVGKQN
ncbi:RNA-binding protein 25-like [Mya arenaria]|nr:RNA-binding protein 25-like [Mya arenaria]XP_052815330.1 RNA-binding protein 25-like [Mya arenaria]